MKKRPFVFYALLATLLAAQEPAADKPPPGGFGRISGRVALKATDNYLRDALVEIPLLNQKVRTDEFGFYSFPRVPAGTHVLVANYIGLDEQRKTVELGENADLTADFDLTSEVYTLETFTVSGSRESTAASLARQDAAENVKSVAAFGSFGGSPTENANDLLMRLPGVAGDIDGTAIRGFTLDLNMVSVDGIVATGVAAMSEGGSTMARSTNISSFSGAIFEEIELVKGITPDMSAGSLSGAINIKSYNVLNMKNKRRFQYDVQGRWHTASLWDHIPLADKRPLLPYVNVSWQEAFDLFGGRRNFGVSLGGLWRQTSTNTFSANQLYQKYMNPAPITPPPPREPGIGDPRDNNPHAYIYDVRFADVSGFTERMELNLKLEYQLTKNDFLFFTARWFDNYSRDQKQMQFRGAATESSLSFKPGYTDTYQEVQNGSFRVDTYRYSFRDNSQYYTFGGKHRWGRVKFDYRAAYNDSEAELRNGDDNNGGLYTYSLASAYSIDKTHDRDRPTLAQLGSGNSIYDVGSYGTANQRGILMRRNDHRTSTLYDVGGDLQYVPTFSEKTIFKTGVAFRRMESSNTPERDYWTFNGAYTDDMMASRGVSYDNYVGGKIPFADPGSMSKSWALATNSGEHAGGGWYKNDSGTYTNTYNDVSESLMTRRRADENVYAAYLQATTILGKLTILGGIRFEKTEASGFGYKRAKNVTQPGTGNGVDRALADWNHPETASFSYHNFFPSIHLTYQLNRLWKLRASWSTSIGRPDLTDYAPSMIISETEGYIRYNNPELVPQHSKNIDVELSYKPKKGSGLLTLGLFRKDLKDFIYEAIIGYESEEGGNPYAFYEQRQKQNGGKAVVQGIELGYQQQNLYFIPKSFGNFGCFANLTLLDTHGDYTGGQRSTSDLAKFVNTTANAGISYRYKRFRANIRLNYTGKYLHAYSDNPYSLVYAKPRVVVDSYLSYNLHRFVTAYLNVRNMFNEKPSVRYQYMSSHTSSYSTQAPVIEFGIRGVF